MIKENLNQEEILEKEEFNEDVEDNLDYESENKPKNKKFKNKVILIELIIIIILGGLVYWQFSSFSDKREEVRNSYDSLNKLELELKSCRELINQDQGEFDRYDYCRQLLNKFVD